MSEERRDTTAGRVGRIWEQVNTLVLAVLIALGIRAFVIEPFRIPSGSMLPTLLIGDHLFVNKFVYGVKVPFTDVRLPEIREPQRGDIVVFTVARTPTRIAPTDRSPDWPTEEFVKRIVGLPGDRVEVRDGVVSVNGRVLERSGGEDTFVDEEGRRLEHFIEDLDGRAHAVLDDPAHPGLPQRAFTVEPGRYFVLGDNRDYSNDSRGWGTVPLRDLKGPAFVIYWSWNFNGSWGELLNPLTWWDLLSERTRWGRIGHTID